MRGLVFAVCLATSFCLAQDWIARYSTGQGEHDDARGLAVDQQGNSYVVGRAQGIELIKYSPYGEELWTRAYGGERFQYFGCMAAAVTRDNGVVVAAAVHQSGSNGFCLLKYGLDGELVWDTVYWHSSAGEPVPFNSPVRVVIDASNRIYVTGSALTSATLADIVVCRFGSTGGLDWSRIVDGPRHDFDAGDGIVLDATGDVLVSGTESGLNDRLNAVVLKYSAEGTPLWTYTYQPNSNWETRGCDIAVATGGRVYVTAWRHNVTGGPYETMLMTLTPSGETLWTGADTASSESPWASLAVDTAGGAYVVGKVARTMRTWKYSASGALAWKADYSTIDTTSTYGVLATLSHDQGVYSTGYRFISEGGFAFLVVKYSAAGQHRWHVCAESMDNCVDRTVAAAVDPSDNLIVTGKSTHLEIQQDDFITMKFRASGAIEEQPATPVEPQHVVLASPFVVISRCRFSVPAGERASDLSIADIAGRAVREIAVPAGRADERVSVTWDARDEQGRPVLNGVYFVRLQQAQAQAQASCKVIVQRQ